MSLSTLAGRPRGFFSPYRYAATVRAPSPYPELEAVFAAAEPRMREVGQSIAAGGAALAALDGPPPVPRWGQSWFPRLDGAAAAAMVWRHRPARIVEVGSGHSTRMLAWAARERGLETTITCLDPEPRADISQLGVTLHRRVLAESDVALFAALEPGDIAFFDSSHLLWPGSDVDMLLNRILPALKPGVVVHVHDILLPDPYPAEWAWRGYTEQNGLSGWLCGGAEILFSSHYARTRLGAADWPGVAALPLPDGAMETSLWLRKR